ncbi:GCN5-related N-acetyltransferase [Xylanimonas cellulosilytica DSM 15894]|uniref:GCN5-related N-acetyltransferase n=1 Tax=Xylanimonas cellulosilytica (strain DSM 15894 / JCM 12276 / CECT 5975 / KCTC 9989 / LMG 20990 / NBRC 107835 / XIL07) TaxID=446471 RepID=D1BVT8_XYLCX|nr:GNAT family protein [Xylanimonas cellulosilytica]ACZ31407.1 GCN5-related N-acetyltransferase [Xylanimonas cellulosilytica DSM 15894]
MTRGPELHGEMVRLRPIEARDAERLWESVTDPVGRRLTGTTATFTRPQIDEWAATISDRPGRYDWAVTPGAVRGGAPVSDLLLGEIVLNDIDEAARSASLRVQFLPDYRGRGYGREAISLVLRFAFDGVRVDGEFEPGLGLHRVSLDVLSINPRAKALYESLGFRQEGRLRDAHRDGDGWVDVDVMSILEDEFRTSHAV